MSVIATANARSPIFLPPAVVKALGITPTSRVSFEIEADGKVSISAKTATFAELLPQLPKHRRNKPASDQDIADAIKAGAARRYRKAQA